MFDGSLAPTHPRRRGEGAARSLYWELDPGSVENLPVTRVNGEDSTVARVLAEDKKPDEAAKLLERVIKDAPKDGEWAKAATERLEKLKAAPKK